MSDSFASVFINYETVKLSINNPSFQNFLILLILLVTALIFSKRKSTVFLDRAQTEELKGAAMLTVVTGHLWVHVSHQPAFPILGDYAVSLFLILSGYGLTLSVKKKPITLKNFVFRRLFRVMIPYWVITGIILTLDFLILQKTYSPQNLSATLAGINIDRAIRELDYARWFITLLLVEYIAFFAANRFLPHLQAALSLLLFNCVLVVLRHYEFFPLGELHQIAAFPLGCILACFLKDITRFIFHARNHFKLIVLLVLYIIWIGLIRMNIEGETSVLYKAAQLGITNLQALLACALVILLVGWVGRLGFTSGFFTFCGMIAFEIYLIHGPLLIKYNPVLELFPTEYIAANFSLFLFLLLALSYGFHLLFNRISFSTKSPEKDAVREVIQRPELHLK